MAEPLPIFALHSMVCIRWEPRLKRGFWVPPFANSLPRENAFYTTDTTGRADECHRTTSCGIDEVPVNGKMRKISAERKLGARCARITKFVPSPGRRARTRRPPSKPEMNSVCAARSAAHTAAKNTFALRARTGGRSEHERKRQRFQGMSDLGVRKARDGCQEESALALFKEQKTENLPHAAYHR